MGDMLILINWNGERLIRSMQLEFGPWKPFSICLRVGEKQENLCRGVRSQDLSDFDP
jgi:hypothetical protein